MISPSHQIIGGVASSVIACVGSLLNIFTIFVLCSDKKLRRSNEYKWQEYFQHIRQPFCPLMKSIHYLMFPFHKISFSNFAGTRQQCWSSSWQSPTWYSPPLCFLSMPLPSCLLSEFLWNFHHPSIIICKIKQNFIFSISGIYRRGLSAVPPLPFFSIGHLSWLVAILYLT